MFLADILHGIMPPGGGHVNMANCCCYPGKRELNYPPGGGPGPGSGIGPGGIGGGTSLLPMLPLIPEHGTHSDSSSSAVCSGGLGLPPPSTRSRPTSMVIVGTTARTLPHPPRKKHSHHYLASRRSKTLIRSRSVRYYFKF